MHAWELILKYYETKNGDYFNSTPARKLSQSFNLDIEGCKSSVSNKQVRSFGFLDSERTSEECIAYIP